MTSLAAELEDFLADFNKRIPEEVRDAMSRADAEMRATGVEERALRQGAIAPDFVLPDINGASVSLGDALAAGPVILTFYRGGWCPYCNLELRAYQRLLPEILEAGAQVIAISPQTAAKSAETSMKNGLDFPLLVDVGSHAAKAFGVAFELPDGLKALYSKFGHALPEINGSDDWILPLPGTFVIAKSGEILLASAGVNYRERLEPADALAAVRGSRNQPAA